MSAWRGRLPSKFRAGGGLVENETYMHHVKRV